MSPLARILQVLFCCLASHESPVSTPVQNHNASPAMVVQEYDARNNDDGEHSSTLVSVDNQNNGSTAFDVWKTASAMVDSEACVSYFRSKYFLLFFGQKKAFVQKVFENYIKTFLCSSLVMDGPFDSLVPVDKKQAALVMEALFNARMFLKEIEEVNFSEIFLCVARDTRYLEERDDKYFTVPIAQIRSGIIPYNESNTKLIQNFLADLYEKSGVVNFAKLMQSCINARIPNPFQRNIRQVALQYGCKFSQQPNSEECQHIFLPGCPFLLVGSEQDAAINTNQLARYPYLPTAVKKFLLPPFATDCVIIPFYQQ